MSTRKATAGLEWYGVKTLFRTVAVGRPSARDAAYDASVSLVEERVVLFKARSFDEAIRAAEKEAREYARLRVVNPYGQRVVVRYLRACDAFELFDTPGVGAEVFSATEVVSKRISDRAIVERHLGKRVDKELDRRRRRNILNREYEGAVKRGA